MAYLGFKHGRNNQKANLKIGLIYMTNKNVHLVASWSPAGAANSGSSSDRHTDHMT